MGGSGDLFFGHGGKFPGDVEIPGILSGFPPGFRQQAEWVPSPRAPPYRILSRNPTILLAEIRRRN